MKLMRPDEEDKREMAGRMYEARDLQMAIEGGHLRTIADVLEYAKESARGLQCLLESPQWVINESCCVDIKASIEHGQAEQLPS